MKFICPRCQARLNIPEERVPAAGAWARCPKCQERFFLKVRETLNPIAAAAPIGRGSAARQMLERLRAKQGRAETSLTGPDGDWGVVVFPAPAPDYRLYGVLAALITAAFLAFLGGAFKAAGGRPASASPPPASSPRVYDQARLAADLAGFKAYLTRRTGYSRQIEYSGLESRVFKYLLARLAPGDCQELASLRLWSPRTRDGFKAVGVCLDGGGTTSELEIDWSVEPALVLAKGSRDRLEIFLSPSGRSGYENGETE